MRTRINFIAKFVHTNGEQGLCCIIAFSFPQLNLFTEGGKRDLRCIREPPGWKFKEGRDTFFSAACFASQPFIYTAMPLGSKAVSLQRTSLPTEFGETLERGF